MARDDPQFRIRMPAELKEIVEEAARKAGRSLNAEIVLRVAESFRVTEGQAGESSHKLSQNELRAFAKKNLDRLDYIDRLAAEFAKQLANRDFSNMDVRDELRPLILERLNQFEDERRKIITTLRQMGLEKELCDWHEAKHINELLK